MLSKKTLLTALTTYFCLQSAIVLSQSQIDFDFKDGAVALYCIEGEDSELPDSVFEKAFPQWVESLQKHANSGEVLRVHYLPNFRSGVFIVVGGDSLEDANSNVAKVEKSIETILDAELKKAGIKDFNHAPCLKLEIGPLALEPK